MSREVRIQEAMRWLGACETAAGEGSAVQKCIRNAMYELGDPRFEMGPAGSAVFRRQYSYNRRDWHNFTYASYEKAVDWLMLRVQAMDPGQATVPPFEEWLKENR